LAAIVSVPFYIFALEKIDYDDPTAVAIEELRAFGIAPTESDAADPGHYKIYFSLDEREQFIVVAATPSDCRTEHNNRALVRKIIRRST
jgi:hypothetical protein